MFVSRRIIMREFCQIVKPSSRLCQVVVDGTSCVWCCLVVVARSRREGDRPIGYLVGLCVIFPRFSGASSTRRSQKARSCALDLDKAVLDEPTSPAISKRVKLVGVFREGRRSHVPYQHHRERLRYNPAQNNSSLPWNLLHQFSRWMLPIKRSDKSTVVTNGLQRPEFGIDPKAYPRTRFAKTLQFLRQQNLVEPQKVGGTTM